MPEGSREAPFYAQLIDRFGERLSKTVLSTEYNTVAEALVLCGLTPDDIDFVSSTTCTCRTCGSSWAPPARWKVSASRARRSFPTPSSSFQRKEVDTFRSPHPMQWAWYVPGGMDHVIEDRLVLIDGDVELGIGVALAWTPGHTDGNQSLVVNTPDGVWVTSENGVAADNWHPHLSKIPGLRKEAEFMGREVILNSNTLEDSIDQYDSMVKEKALADPNRADPRWMNVFPSSELPAWRRQWPIVPSFTYGGMSYGTIEPPERG